MRISVGAALNLYIGQPTSKDGHEVRTEVTFSSGDFMMFDHSNLTVRIPQNVTTDKDEHIYYITIHLTDTVLETSATVTVRL